MSVPVARRMWTMFEPLHDVTYFTQEARDHFEAAGLRGFWRGYFGGRCAPLGPVDAAPVTACFFSFAPRMVQRALPEIWSLATPEAALKAREEGAVAALSRLLEGHEVERAADLLWQAASSAHTAGRVLAAANQALPVPDEPLARLWHATTVLREHRGDGHIAALVSWELDGCDALVWRASMDLSRNVLQPARGWTDEEWEEAVLRLKTRGWIDVEGHATALASQAHRDIEAVTDRIAQRPWDELGPEATQQLITALKPLAQLAFRELPDYNPVGLPAPDLGG